MPLKGEEKRKLIDAPPARGGEDKETDKWKTASYKNL